MLNGSPLDTVRQPQAIPSGTSVLPFGAMLSIARLMAARPSGTVTSVSGVIGSVVQL